MGEAPHWEAGGVIAAWRASPRETAFRCQQGPEMSSVKAEHWGGLVRCLWWDHFECQLFSFVVVVVVFN